MRAATLCTILFSFLFIPVLFAQNAEESNDTGKNEAPKPEHPKKKKKKKHQENQAETGNQEDKNEATDEHREHRSREERGNDAPDLLGPLYASPAQLRELTAPRVEARMFYETDTANVQTQSNFLGGSSASDTTTTKETVPLLGVAGMAPVGSLFRFGVAASYAPGTANESDSQSDFSSNSKLTMSSATVIAAMNLSKSVGLGVQYEYSDVDISTSSGSGAGSSLGSTSTDGWTNRGRVGLDALFGQMNLGIAYETRARKADYPPSLVAYSNYRLAVGTELGLKLVYTFNQDLNSSDNHEPDNSIDAVAHLAISPTKTSHLILSLGYLPLSDEYLSGVNPSEFFHLPGYGYEADVDLMFDMTKTVRVGGGVEYQSVGTSAATEAGTQGGKSTDSGFAVTARLAAAI